MTDTEVLHANWKDKKGEKDADFERCVTNYGKRIMSRLKGSKKTQEEKLGLLDIFSPDLDYASTLYCDIWLEGAGLHGQLYTGQREIPTIGQVESHEELSGFRYSTHRSYSGNASGIIGESLFALVLLKHYKLKENSFAHFGTTRDFFPDFGIVCTSCEIRDAVNQKIASTNRSISEQYVLPAEVKGITNPDVATVSERVSKAFRQIRSFWGIRNGQMHEGWSTGPSLVFLALRNPYELDYYCGVLIWLI